MSRPATSRLKVNPPLGSPPTLEWRAVGELQIDPVYQRSILTGTSQTLIRRIAMFWDWGLCQPLAVARRTDGTLMVVDGQHRLEAARLRRDIPHLPCVITSYASAGDEAAAFVALNQQRRPLSALDLFKAALAANDDEATAVMAAITDAGLSLATSTNLGTIKPGSVSNIGGLQRCYRRQNPTVLRTALRVLADAYPGEVLRYAGTIFPGIAAVVLDELRLRSAAGDTIAPLAAIVRQRTQIEWRSFIKASVGQSGGMAREASEMVFREAWSARHFATSPHPLGASNASVILDRGEIGWCDQCDRKVTGERAAKCTDRHCSMRKAQAA